MKMLVSDSINNIPEFNQTFHSRIEDLRQIEKCVHLLIIDYNNTDIPYKIVPTKETKEIVAAIKNYIGLILYKLSKYVNDYLQQDPNRKQKYLKDSLTFNCRHKNYALYKGLKRSIETLFEAEDIKTEEIPSIIQRLIVNERVLVANLLYNEEYIEVGAFNIQNGIDRDDPDFGDFYGDPTISLLSYFQFFEEPRNEDDNVTEDDEIIFYDWLEYEGVDIYSSQMDVQEHEGKQNKVLIEFRGFQRMIVPYMLNMADAELTRNMERGICNKMTNKFVNTLPVTPISNFKKLIQLYDDDEAYPEKGVKKNKTRKV
uniref:Uncharacterized protein n=1 Tax=viral metagenome TaxID=1070528 RepID=A0A6C0I3I4_9ZZZZ